MNSTDYLFIYGTLLPETKTELSEWLSLHSSVVCRGSITGKLFMISNYPAAIFDLKASSNVFGQVVKMLDRNKCFHILDEYEGISPDWKTTDEYYRTIKPVQCADQITRECWMYLYNLPTSHLKEIPSGNFPNYLSTSNNLKK
jgi:gamma-glutamylcyclotransferase (GGCT)/AIG2-like uncharacterized protein YtfP